MKWAWLVLAACGSSPPPAAPIANQPSIEAVTCRDASVVLRGAVDAEDPKAGPARESAILRACTDDHWSADVLACAGSSKQPQACLAKLTDPQHESLEAKLGTWEAQFAGDPDGGAGVPHEHYVDCSQLVDDVTRYAPPFDAEHEWQVRGRAKLIEDTCNNDGWSEDTKECVLAAVDNAGTSACLLPEASAPKLLQQLTDLDGTATKIAAAKTKPASITCAKAVAAHYGDAKWKARAKEKPAASRTAMQKACSDDKWTEMQRACVVVADDPSCYDNPGRWGYPALVVAKRPNVPDECAIYEAVMVRIESCSAVPEASRGALAQAFGEAAKTWAGLSPDEAKQIAPICKGGADAMMSAFPLCNGW
jgi:hypothetical protein